MAEILDTDKAVGTLLKLLAVVSCNCGNPHLCDPSEHGLECVYRNLIKYNGLTTFTEFEIDHLHLA